MPWALADCDHIVGFPRGHDVARDAFCWVAMALGVACSLLAPLKGCAGGAPAQVPASSRIGSLVVELTARLKTHRPGEPLALEVKLTNRGSVPVTVRRVFLYGGNLQFSIRNSAGKPVKWPGSEIVAGVPPPQKAQECVVLDPGYALVCERVEASYAIRLFEEGAYTVACRYDAPDWGPRAAFPLWHGVINSNEARIRVVAGGKR